MAPARSFRELKVHQAAREAARLIFESSKSFPHPEQYSLTDQIRRSSRAVEAMVAEGWARRRYKAAFVKKVDEALDQRYDAIGGMLSRMIDRADDFCKYEPGTDYRSVVREEEEYPITDH
jgi:predicted nucleotidyltransferase